MRGKRVGRHFCKFRHGITPAHAGKTHFSCFYPINNQDHPRACGENTSGVLSSSWLCRSPPRMRGKHSNGFGQDGWWRITPAHAGKTFPYPSYIYSSEDHPRACGENLKPLQSCVDMLGSPPRMRGKHENPSKGATATRITPAHAGKT